MKQNKRIETLRKDIDGCDDLIFEVLHQRFLYVTKIGIIKKKLNLPVVNKSRFNDIVNNKIDQYKNNPYLSEEFIRKVYDLIHEESCKIQNK